MIGKRFYSGMGEESFERNSKNSTPKNKQQMGGGGGGSLTDKHWQVQLKTNKKGKGLTASFLSCRVKICGDMHGERNLKWLLNVKFHTNKIVDISTPAHFKSWQLIFKCLYILLIPI